MSSNPLKVGEQIEKIREENNKNWIDLIRLAVTHAPEEAKVIMNRINKHDENINELFQQLSDTL